MKNARQNKILELIENNDVDTQDTLIKLLLESGFSVTQTTVSRDIRQLNLVKATTPGGSYKYVSPDIRASSGAPVLNSALTDAVIKIEAAENIVVIKTFAGMANALAVCVDSLHLPEIVGSVAGDDTILLVIKNCELALKTEAELKKSFLLKK